MTRLIIETAASIWNRRNAGEKPRRLAAANGYMAVKTTKQTLPVNNGGGFMLVALATSRDEAEARFDSSAKQIIKFFEEVAS